MKRICLPLALFAAPPLWAQTPADASASDNTEIVVTGAGLPLPPGTPAYGSVILDRDRLTSSASGRVENVLSDVAGFQQFRRSDSRSANPSAQGATLRALGGNASSRTLVLLDGVPVADPFFGYIPFSALTPERLAVVRITRGGGGGAFGAGAVAGTIELASATRDQLPNFAASASVGSEKASELTASFSPDLGAGFLSVSGRWDRGDGFETTPAAQRTVATVPAAYDSWSVNLRAVIRASASSELQFRGTVFDDRRTLRFAGADSLSEGQDASIRFVSRGAWQVDALAYVQARNFSNVVISSSTFRRSLDQRRTPSTGLGGKIELRPPVGEGLALRIGADARHASGVMLEDAYNANLAANPVTARRRAGGEQLTTGVFAEGDWTLGDLVLTGGVRADRWTIRDGFFRETSALTGALTRDDRFADRADWETSVRAGFLLPLGEALTLRGAGYTGFRLPTLNELYRPFVVFPITTRANAQLTPEKLKGAEAGIELRPVAGTVLAATVFYNRLDDAIANVTLTPTIRQRRNVDRILAKGVELTASARAGDFALSASYAYSRSRVEAPGTAFDGLVPAQSPRHAATGTLSWEPERGPRLSATLRYVSDQYEDDLQTDTLPGVITLDAVARVPIGPHFALVARGENLLDEDVVTRNAGGSIDLGTPRTLWLGIRFER